MKFTYTLDNIETTIVLEKNEAGYAVKLGEQNVQVQNIEIDGNQIIFNINGKKYSVTHATENTNTRWLAMDGLSYRVEKPQSNRKRRGASSGRGNSHTAPMPGQVREVLVAIGDQVEQGQTLILLEAMKMEIRVNATHSGEIVALHVTVGQSINKDELLIEVQEDSNKTLRE